MKKKFLTSDSLGCYAESLKTYIHGFRTRQFCDFFVYPYGVLRAGNILNTCQSVLYVAFSEAPLFSQFTRAILKRTYKMTNTVKKSAESTIQSLYRYYCEMRDTWYQGNYTLQQENIYGDVFNALDDAIMKLPAQCEADRQIKYKHIKNMLTLDGTQAVSGVDKYVLDIINSLAAE